MRYTINHPTLTTGKLGDVEIGPGGLVYVALDPGTPAGSDGRILEFTPNGSFVTSFTLPDDPYTGNGHYPFGFDVLEDGSFLVARPNQQDREAAALAEDHAR